MTKLGKDAAWYQGQHQRWPAEAGEDRGSRFAPSEGGPLEGSESNARDTSAGRKKVAAVVPICTRGYNSATLIDGIMHYWAEYNCLDGQTIERRSMGMELDGFIPQP